MKFTAAAALGLAAAAMAMPAIQSRADNSTWVYEAELTFHAGPAEYSLTVPADGTIVQTNSDLSVNIIDAFTYNPGQCTFYTAGDATFVSNLSDEGRQVVVGPPQPITSVKCEGYCIPNYSNCYGYFGPDDQYYGPLGPCCAGFCAANKCRPWNGV